MWLWLRVQTPSHLICHPCGLEPCSGHILRKPSFSALFGPSGLPAFKNGCAQNPNQSTEFDKINSYIIVETLFSGIPEFKYVANMHGNEVTGREHLLKLMDYMCEAITVGNEDTEDVIWLLENTRIHIMPSMNPDGFELANKLPHDAQVLNHHNYYKYQNR